MDDTVGNAAAATLETEGRHTPQGSMGTRGHRGHLDTQVIGACVDFPAVAAQWERGALSSPSGAPLPILRLVVLASRRVSRAMTLIGSERRIVGVLIESARRRGR